MVNAYVKNDEIKLEGHAKLNIVCSSISTALYVIINACVLFDKDSIYYKDNGDFVLRNIKKDDITNTLFENFIMTLKELEKQYNDNIKIWEVK